jgi:hypothetical protein
VATRLTADQLQPGSNPGAGLSEGFKKNREEDKNCAAVLRTGECHQTSPWLEGYCSTLAPAINPTKGGNGLRLLLIRIFATRENIFLNHMVLTGKNHFTTENVDQDNLADAPIYKYSQLLFTMVRFTIVNIREVHQNHEVRLMPHFVLAMFLRTSSTLRKRRTAQQIFE